MVEAGTKYLKREGNFGDFTSTTIISLIVALTLQPIEKKLVIDQLLLQFENSVSKKKNFFASAIKRHLSI